MYVRPEHATLLVRVALLVVAVAQFSGLFLWSSVWPIHTLGMLCNLVSFFVTDIGDNSLEPAEAPPAASSSVQGSAEDVPALSVRRRWSGTSASLPDPTLLLKKPEPPGRASGGPRERSRDAARVDAR